MLNPGKTVGTVALTCGLASLMTIPAYSQPLCRNYVVLPSGRQICLDNAPVRQAPESDAPPMDMALPSRRPPRGSDAGPAADYTTYLDQLQTCTPHVAELPFPLLPEVQVKMTIQGPQAVGCAVDMTLIDEQAGTEAPYLSCVYSPETVALMTDETGYAEAAVLDSGEGTLQVSSDTPRAQALSAALNRECSS